MIDIGMHGGGYGGGTSSVFQLADIEPVYKTVVNEPNKFFSIGDDTASIVQLTTDADANVYAADDKGRVTKINLDGSIAWVYTFNTGISSVFTHMKCYNGKLYVMYKVMKLDKTLERADIGVLSIASGTAQKFLTIPLSGGPDIAEMVFKFDLDNFGNLYTVGRYNLTKYNGTTYEQEFTVASGGLSIITDLAILSDNEIVTTNIYNGSSINVRKHSPTGVVSATYSLAGNTKYKLFPLKKTGEILTLDTNYFRKISADFKTQRDNGVYGVTTRFVDTKIFITSENENFVYVGLYNTDSKEMEIIYYDYDNGELIQRSSPKIYLKPGEVSVSCYVDQDFNYYFSTNKGNVIKVPSWEIQKNVYSTFNFRLTGVTAAKDGTVYAATGARDVVKFNPDGTSASKFVNGSTAAVTCCCLIDPVDNNYMYVSSNNALYKIGAGEKWAPNAVPEWSVIVAASNNKYIKPIYKNGFIYWTDQLTKIKKIDCSSGQVVCDVVYGDLFAGDLFMDSNNRLWALSRYGDLWQVDLETCEKVNALPYTGFNPTNTGTLMSDKISELPNGNLAISTSLYLSIFDTEKKIIISSITWGSFLLKCTYIQSMELMTRVDAGGDTRWIDDYSFFLEAVHSNSPASAKLSKDLTTCDLVNANSGGNSSTDMRPERTISRDIGGFLYLTSRKNGGVTKLKLTPPETVSRFKGYKVK